jgi:NAD(P)-dependent dehydrogenase (short-subunit alcohol dehydrogenase family)
VPDTIISNAGLASQGSLFAVQPEALQAVFAVNTFPIFGLLQHLLRPVRAAGSIRRKTDKEGEAAAVSGKKRRKICHVIGIASCLGLGAVANMSVYCATKASLLSILESLRLEIQQLHRNLSGSSAQTSLTGAGFLVDDIQVTSVCPFRLQDGGMFQSIRPLAFPLLTPSISCGFVAHKIMLEMARSWHAQVPATELWLPSFIYGLPLIRCLPTRLYDWTMHLLGANQAAISNLTFKR